MNYLIESIKKTFEECIKIAEDKNKDYSSTENPFSNIETCKVYGINPEHGLLIRMMDKFSRLNNLIVNKKEASVKDESIEDTIDDMINYLAILKAYRNYNNE